MDGAACSAAVLHGTMMNAVCLVCLLVVVFSHSIGFTSCGEGLLQVQSVDVDPFPPKEGHDVTLAATGQVSETVQGGTYAIKVKLGFIQVYEHSGDLCTFSKAVQCPVAAGPVSIQDTIKVPSIAPAGKYKVELSAKSDQGKTVFCIEADLDIEAKEGSAGRIRVVKGALE